MPAARVSRLARSWFTGNASAKRDMHKCGHLVQQQQIPAQQCKGTRGSRLLALPLLLLRPRHFAHTFAAQAVHSLTYKQAPILFMSTLPCCMLIEKPISSTCSFTVISPSNSLRGMWRYREVRPCEERPQQPHSQRLLDKAQRGPKSNGTSEMSCRVRDQLVEQELIYEKLPKDIADRHVLLMDPILATGNSAARAIQASPGTAKELYGHCSAAIHGLCRST